VDDVGGQRKKKGGRVTPKGGHFNRLSTAERAGLEDIFERLLRSAPKDLSDDIPPLAVEMWASQMWSIWASSELVGMDAAEVFAGGMIDYAARRGTTAALIVLRALSAVAPDPHGSRARREAERLAVRGTPERSWAPGLGTERPTTAWVSFDPIDDDGVAVMVGFDGPGHETTIGVYVDHNLGGLAKDAFAVPAGIAEVLANLRQNRDEPDDPEYKEISLKEAAARWRVALEMTELTFDPPTTEDFDHLRALVLARLATLPVGGKVPQTPSPNDEERDELLAEFLESDEVVRLTGVGDGDSGDTTVEELADQLLAFSLDYALGTPLRFSPVMVEIFCLDWAPRKIPLDGDAFTLLPDVLAAWIRFVGRRRAIPERSIRASVDATYEFAPEMIELSQDPEVWGPAKTMALALQQRGIDMSDQAALDDFVDEVNRSGGIDVLADSLVESIATRR
jgi:hypothetical protein